MNIIINLVSHIVLIYRLILGPKSVLVQQSYLETIVKAFREDFTLMMLLRRGAAFTDSRRKVSVSWPPAGRMTPLRRPRDALGGMESGAASPHSPSADASRSDMMRSGI